MSEAVLAAIRERASALGFAAVGVAPLPTKLRRDYYQKWIAEGQHAQMTWLERNNERRLAPENCLPQARSVLCLAMNYEQDQPKRGYRIAKYALGGDYHKLILNRLKQLCRYMRETYGSDQKPYVDTGPVLEKPIAEQAGIGWQGKSTILINRSEALGTWCFLGEIITTLDLPPGKPANDHCGRCTRCIDACPTGAITAPYQLDARRCLSYWSIEHKGSIPEKMREAMGDRLFGCDDCLDVCPWNRWAKQTREQRFMARDYPRAQDMLLWDTDTFNTQLAGTAIRRLGLERWKRNICIIIGNTGDRNDLALLSKVIQTESDLVKEHAQWAITRIKRRYVDGD